MKCGAPVVNFSVMAKMLCSPFHEILSTLNSRPSTYSSTSATPAKLALRAASMALSSSLGVAILVTPLLPDLSDGLTIAGYGTSSRDKSVHSSMRRLMGEGSPCSSKDTLIKCLSVLFATQSRLFHVSPSSLATYATVTFPKSLPTVATASTSSSRHF